MLCNLLRGRIWHVSSNTNHKEQRVASGGGNRSGPFNLHLNSHHCHLFFTFPSFILFLSFLGLKKAAVEATVIWSWHEKLGIWSHCSESRRKPQNLFRNITTPTKTYSSSWCFESASLYNFLFKLMFFVTLFCHRLHLLALFPLLRSRWIYLMHVCQVSGEGIRASSRSFSSCVLWRLSSHPPDFRPPHPHSLRCVFRPLRTSEKHTTLQLINVNFLSLLDPHPFKTPHSIRFDICDWFIWDLFNWIL